MQLTIDPNSKVAGHAILQIFFFCYFSSHNEWNTWSLLLIWWSTQPVDRIWIIWWRFLKHQHGYWFKISPWIMIILMIFKKWSLSTLSHVLRLVLCMDLYCLKQDAPCIFHIFLVSFHRKVWCWDLNLNLNWLASLAWPCRPCQGPKHIHLRSWRWKNGS